MTRAECDATITKLIGEFFELDLRDIKPEKELYADLAVDSLGAVELALELEEQFGLDISDEDIVGMRTVGDVHEYVASRVIKTEGVAMKTYNAIRNTTSELARDPLMGLIEGTPDAIEASERAGQHQLVQSEVLPKKMSEDARRSLELVGVVFGEQVDGDDLFVHVTLPTGWTKQSTDHAMWSDLLDDKGRKRAGIFYKAAFYDRRADLRICHRFTIDFEYPPRDSAAEKVFSRRAFVKRDATILFDSGWLTPPTGSFEDPARDAAENWLDENRPGWKDPTKYWEEV